MTEVKESVDAMENVMLPATSSSMINLAVGGLGRNILGRATKTCYPMEPLLLSGTGMNSSGPLSDLTLLEWALGSSWCMTMSE